MYLKREIERFIQDNFFKKRAFLIIGARQTGKTTLSKKIMKPKNSSIYFNADFLHDQEIWKPESVEYLQSIVKDYKIIVIDEAQNVKDIGLVIKILVDNFPNKQIIATGSSNDLINKTGELLAGRKWEINLFPLSYCEVVNATNAFEAKKNLNFFLTYGLYPEVYLDKNNAENILLELANSYLLKDILMWANIKKSNKLIRLLKLLAYQIGEMVSYNKLANELGIDAITVEKYIDLLEKSFIIFRLNSFSGNLRTELKKSRKIYFWDIGIRNAIIQDFSLIDTRQDKSHIWENFIVAEMIKNSKNSFNNEHFYFWRSKDKAEIDIVKIKNKQIDAFEIKFKKKNVRLPDSFATYKPKSFELIHSENYEQYIL